MLQIIAIDATIFLGTAPITKKQRKSAKGMTPIAKNIRVVDEQGKEYEATYLKRAKGLVKNGRARFIAENKICLACPPKNELEDNDMSENKNTNTKESSNIPNNVADALSNLMNSEAEKKKEKLSMNYVLEQIEKVQTQLTDLKNTINNIGCVGDSDYDGETAHDEVGLAKIKAITEVFHHREESLQSLLAFYQKMYDDLSGKKVLKYKALSALEHCAGDQKLMDKFNGALAEIGFLEE